jgi:signal transduction histidine kinase
MEPANNPDFTVRLIESLRKAEARALAGKAALAVMHEIRNPLEALGNLIYLASQQSEYPAQVREKLGEAEHQLEFLVEISSQTLGLASHSYVRKRVCLVSLAETALRMHRKAIDAKKIDLKKELPTTLLVTLHSGNILQVLSNLIGNAIEALPYGGSLHLRLRRSLGDAHILIADNGHGIPIEHLTDVFRPFFTTKQEHGNGLGLAISKDLVEAHAGTIRFRSSVVPGRSGTTFRVCIPA